MAYTHTKYTLCTKNQKLLNVKFINYLLKDLIGIQRIKTKL